MCSCNILWYGTPVAFVPLRNPKEAGQSLEPVRHRSSVLVGIDFSEGAANAYREGLWLARRAGLGLQVLHVTDKDVRWAPGPEETDWLGKTEIDPTLVLVRQGLPWVEIVRHAIEVRTSVIVLGSHGATGFQAMTLGSTANRVAVRAPCPVLFVARTRERLASDESEVPSPHSLQEYR